MAQQSFGQEKERKRYRYRPHTLKESVIQLERIHDDSTKSIILDMTEDEFLAGSHMGVGMWIRNNWGLWRGGKLAKHIQALGYNHPDDMSWLILKCYYRELKGLDWEEKAAETQEEDKEELRRHIEHFRSVQGSLKTK